MENLENKPLLQPETTDLQEQVASLQHLLTSILVLMIMVSGTFNIYLLRQWRSSKDDLKVVRPQVGQMIADYNRTTGPLIGDFIKRLTEYAKTTPEFNPILAKYGLKPSTGPAAPSPAKPGPAAAPTKKP